VGIIMESGEVTEEIESEESKEIGILKNFITFVNSVFGRVIDLNKTMKTDLEHVFRIKERTSKILKDLKSEQKYKCKNDDTYMKEDLLSLPFTCAPRVLFNRFIILNLFELLDHFERNGSVFINLYEEEDNIGPLKIETPFGEIFVAPVEETEYEE
jgi:hypothetical protein